MSIYFVLSSIKLANSTKKMNWPKIQIIKLYFISVEFVHVLSTE